MYVVLFMNCVLLFSLKLQTLVTLSTTKAEYVSLSHSLCDTISIMDMLHEVLKQKLFDCTYQTQVKCTAFEDKSGALELVMVPKICPRTNHINTKYHYFRSHLGMGRITVKSFSTEEQVADIFTKPLG